MSYKIFSDGEFKKLDLKEGDKRFLILANWIILLAKSGILNYMDKKWINQVDINLMKNSPDLVRES